YPCGLSPTILWKANPEIRQEYMAKLDKVKNLQVLGAFLKGSQARRIKPEKLFPAPPPEVDRHN
ncbi:MAG: hypothetical protein ABFD50_17970, partial [Smithella sp.]